MVTVTVGAPTHPVSDRLYGVFFEDINCGADGGLNANMVNNYSFDGVYLDHQSLHLQGSRRWRTEADPLRFWIFDGVSALSCGTWIRGEHGQRVDTECIDPPVHENSRYARLTLDGAYARVENLGYNGGGEYAGSCAMSIVEGATYEFSAYVRSVIGSCTLRVSVVDRYGAPLSDAVEFQCRAEDGTQSEANNGSAEASGDIKSGIDVKTAHGVGAADGNAAYAEPNSIDIDDDPFTHDGWCRIRGTINGIDTGYGKLRIEILRSAGAYGMVMIDLDCVSLMDANWWGAGDPKWRFGKMRRDLVEAIAALNPSFVRFPGGCIVEGVTPGNEYRWKDTVGALPARRQQYSMWGFRAADGSSYSQSYQIGFYEYFCLCEDLQAHPLPTLFAGITCQSPYRDPQHIATDSAYFHNTVVQDYLDLIDFANGDPATDPWARVRARMGHPEPFGLDMIGVGNENYGPDYVDKYDVICQAVHAKDPSILCVMSAGLFPFKIPMRRSWDHARDVAAEASQVEAMSSATEQAVSTQSTDEQPVTNQPAAKQSAANHSAANHSATNYSATEQTTADQSTPEQQYSDVDVSQAASTDGSATSNAIAENGGVIENNSTVTDGRAFGNRTADSGEAENDGARANDDVPADYDIAAFLPLVGALDSPTGDAVIVDEHSYHSPEWFISQANRYDNYPRCGAGVYVGEYSANGYFAAQPQAYETSCRWDSALAEAVFLTGCERNSDVVRMTSYAPLLAHITGKGWEQNLIEFNPATVNPTINYEVQQLFSTNVGSTAYECTVSGETDALYVSATGDEGLQRFVKIVNVGSRTEHITLDVAPGLRALGMLGHLAPLLRIETLSGMPHAKSSLDYVGHAQGGVHRECNEYWLSSAWVHVALSIAPYSVTVVTVRDPATGPHAMLPAGPTQARIEA